jgi:tetratricopeptide (TPR) repeat protein
MNAYKFKGLSAIFLIVLLSSCSDTRPTIDVVIPVTTAQSDIDKGVGAAQEKDYQGAIAFFSSSIDKNSRIAEAYYHRGRSYQKLGMYSKSKRDYHKALELNMSYPEVHNSLGVLYTSQGEYGDAIDSYTIAISFNQRYAKPHINRGVVHFRQGSYQKALFDFTRALEIEPYSTLALKNRANVYNRMGAKDAVCDDLRQLCSLGSCLSFDKLANTGYCNN